MSFVFHAFSAFAVLLVEVGNSEIFYYSGSVALNWDPTINEIKISKKGNDQKS